jgi:hypothetical protein
MGLLPNGAKPIGLSKVSLVGCDVFHATVAMLTVVPLHQAIHPTTHGIEIAKSTDRITLVLFHCYEQ